jgi:hypothetical protein
MFNLLNNTSLYAIVAMMAADTAKSPSETPQGGGKQSIEKPTGSGLDRFKSSKLTVEKVEALITGLPHGSISDAKDWVRLHEDETNYWSDELCFVNVPIPGQKRDTLHLIDVDMAAKLPPGKVLRHRLALASKPHNIFFLAHVPSQNLDNEWNKTNLQGCELATQFWVSATSLKNTGVEKYKIEISEGEKKGKKPFPDPKWPQETLWQLIEATFTGRMISSETDPAWIRLIGDVQTLS